MDSTAKKKETKKPEAVEASAEQVLTPEAIATVNYGKEEIKIQPLDVRGVIIISKFMTRHIAKMVSDSDIQAFLRLPKVTEQETMLVFITQLFESLEPHEIIDVLCAITRKDREFIESGFSVANMMGVVRAFVLTEDFERIFLEAKTLWSGLQRREKTQG